ncbi:MAG: hypothetical protein EOM12_07525 [Verrucomicrobiae bacterium]|nr:hypothetical protein [Verrucomicrobiae bacterium]
MGVLLSDADVLVWSPTPLLVEDQSHKEEKPNAIDLQGGSIQKLEKAVGVVSAQAANEPANELFPNAAIDQEIGLDPLPEDKLKQAELALERNPPKAFDLARQERVFNSKLEFVELSLTDYKMSKKVMPVSSELMALSDDEKTKNKWRNQFTLFENHDCKVKLTYKKRKIDVDEAFLDAERKRLDKEYLVAITGYGKVIPIHLKQDFQREIESFRTLLKEYTEGIQKSISKHLEETVNELVLNLLPRFKKNPPPNFKKRQLTDKVGDDEAKGYIRDELENASCKIEQHVAPKLRVVYKAINYESFHSNDFVEKLNNAFGDNATDRIFEEHDSARGKLK